MDILFKQQNRDRRSRSYDAMHKHTAFVLKTAFKFYKAVEKKLLQAG
jgi:hypothetical protein